MNETPSAEHAERLASSHAFAESRIKAFIASVPPDLVHEEQHIAANVNNINASPRVKLRKVYDLLDRISQHTQSFVPCSAGCSDCCKMNVSISDVEAEQIGARINRTPESPKTPTRPDDTSKHLGVPCPFLKNDECSIYDFRPVVCRKHFTFDASPYWCHPSRSTSGALPQLALSGVDSVYAVISIRRKTIFFADIRDFFPS